MQKKHKSVKSLFHPFALALNQSLKTIQEGQKCWPFQIKNAQLLRYGFQEVPQVFFFKPRQGRAKGEFPFDNQGVSNLPR